MLNLGYIVKNQKEESLFPKPFIIKFSEWLQFVISGIIWNISKTNVNPMKHLPLLYDIDLECLIMKVS